MPAPSKREERALKTVESLVDQEVTEVSEESSEEKANGKPKSNLSPSDIPPQRKKAPTEDFFEYLQKILPDEWSSSKTGGIYIYRESSKGNVRVNDEPLHRAISLQELRDEYVPKFGPGTYRLQFNTSLKHLSSCGEKVTLDPQGVLLGSPSSGSFYGGSVPQDLPGIGRAFESIADISKNAATAAVEVVKSAQMEQNKPIDIAAIVTAVAGLLPKQDNNVMVQLLESQRKDAEARAERELKSANERADRDRTTAQERADRDQKFFQLMMDQQKERGSDQQKFFELLLKEKDKKEDSYGVGDVLKELFKAFAEERLEGGGEPRLSGWPGVAQAFLPKIAEVAQTYAPLIAAKMQGQPVTPQQVQQIQAQVAAQTQPVPSNGQLPPAQAVFPSTEQLLMDLLNRIGLYLTSRETPNAEYILEVMDEEYSPVVDLFSRLPKDQILSTIGAYPLGQQLLKIPNAQLFLESLIDAIKNPQEGEEDLSEQGLPLAQEVPAKRKRGHPPKAQ